MSHSSLSSEQFKGVLHGHDVNDDPATKFSAPYDVKSKQEIEHYAARLTSIHMRPTEASHAGTCEEAGCSF